MLQNKHWNKKIYHFNFIKNYCFPKVSSKLRSLTRICKSKVKQNPILTSGTDWTGPKPDGPAIGSVESVGSDDIGLVIPLLVAINPLDVDVHVDVVVALQNPEHLRLAQVQTNLDSIQYLVI